MIALILIACGLKADPVAAPAAPSAPAGPPDCAPFTTLPSGLAYCDLVVGTGMVPAPGLNTTVHYTGWLLDGTQFDSSRSRGEPFTFAIGAGMVIRGWDEGVGSMAIGGRRILVIPPSLGYGERDLGDIPPNSTLKFDVELISAVP